MVAGAKPTSTTSRLAANLPEVLAWLQRSSMPAAIKADIIEVLQHHLDAAGGRAQAAAQRSRERSTAMRARIRAAVGVAPALDYPHYPLAQLVAVVQRRLGEQAPDARTIRAELQAMRHEIDGIPEPKCRSISDSVPST